MSDKTIFGPKLNDQYLFDLWTGKQANTIPLTFEFYHSVFLRDARGHLVKVFHPRDFSLPFDETYRVGRWYPRPISVWLALERRGVVRSPSVKLIRIATSTDDVVRIREKESSKHHKEFRRTQGKVYPSPKVLWDSPSSLPRRPSESSFSLQPGYLWKNGTVLQDSPVSVQMYSRTYTSTSTPGFRTLKKGARFPVNPYSLSVWHQNMSPFVLASVRNATNETTLELRRMPLNHSLPGAPSADPLVEGRALKKLIDAINGDTGNVLVDLVQYNQFIHLVGTTAGRLTGSIGSLRKGNIPGAIQSLWGSATPRFRRGGQPSVSKSLADNWLELQYGWKPLLNDIRSAALALAKFNLADADVHHASSRASKPTDVQSVVFGAVSPAPVVGNLSVSTTTSVSFGVRYKISSPLVSFLAQTGFTNPLSLAWELLPFSFVVDWFLPIGSFLDALSAFHGLTFVDGYKTTFLRQRSSMAISGTYLGFNEPGFTVTERGTWEREWVTVSRVKLTAFPSPVFPTLKSPFSGTHVTNALALLRSNFR